MKETGSVISIKVEPGKTKLTIQKDFFDIKNKKDVIELVARRDFSISLDHKLEFKEYEDELET